MKRFAALALFGLVALGPVSTVLASQPVHAAEEEEDLVDDGMPGVDDDVEATIGRDAESIDCVQKYGTDYVPPSKMWGIFWTHPCVDWGHGIVALGIRLVGIFVLLAMIQIGMQVAGAIIMRTESGQAKRTATKKPAAKPGAGAKPAAPKAPEGSVPGEVVAAIAAALEMESSVGVIPDEVLASGATTSWSYAGRAASMNARVTVSRSVEKP